MGRRLVSDLEQIDSPSKPPLVDLPDLSGGVAHKHSDSHMGHPVSGRSQCLASSGQELTACRTHGGRPRGNLGLHLSLRDRSHGRLPDLNWRDP